MDNDLSGLDQISDYTEAPYSGQPITVSGLPGKSSSSQSTQQNTSSDDIDLNAIASASKGGGLYQPKVGELNLDPASTPNIYFIPDQQGNVAGFEGWVKDQKAQQITDQNQSAYEKKWKDKYGDTLGGIIADIVPKVGGAAQAALATATGAILAPFATVAKASGDIAGGSQVGNSYFDKVMGLGYQPTSEQGQEYTQKIGEGLNQLMMAHPVISTYQGLKGA